MNSILFLLGAVGMSHIIIDGSIFDLPRTFLKRILPNYLHNLFECYMCCGFWCGIFMSYFFLKQVDFFYIFSCGCTISLLSHFHATILNYLESFSVRNLNG